MVQIHAKTLVQSVLPVNVSRPYFSMRSHGAHENFGLGTRLGPTFFVNEVGTADCRHLATR